MMRVSEKARMIALEAAQLAENVERWEKAQIHPDLYTICCVDIGKGGSWGAIKSDIVKLRRDLNNLSHSLPDSAGGRWERDTND